MKRFKTSLLTLTLILTLTPFMQSCLDDDNDNSYLAIATFRTTESNEHSFTLDNGKKMYPQQKNYSAPDNGQRAYVYFDILEKNESIGEYQIEVRAIEKVLTKDVFIMDEQTADSIGDDKINITNIWFGDDYLNIRFQFLGTRNPAKLHMVNLVRNETEGADTNEEEGYISLEFRHNAYEDSPVEVLNGIVSFKPPVADEALKGIKIRYRSIYDGVKYVKIDFKQQVIDDSGFLSAIGTSVTRTTVTN